MSFLMAKNCNYCICTAIIQCCVRINKSCYNNYILVLFTYNCEGCVAHKICSHSHLRSSNHVILIGFVANVQAASKKACL